MKIAHHFDASAQRLLGRGALSLGLGLFLGLCAALLAIVTGTPAHAAPPQRIVSLNVCIDQILVELVPRGRIAAVTHLATDPLSVATPERARGLPQTRGAAEAVLALNPDLILAGTYSTPATVQLLRQVGRRVEQVSQPHTIAGIRALIVNLGALVDAPATAETLVATMDARLARATRPRTADSPTALVYQPNDYVSGTQSLIGEALALAGYRDASGSLQRARSGRVGMEALALAKPDLLVLATGPLTYRTAVADNLRHPVLADLAYTRQTQVVPWPLWLCGTQHIATAVEQLAAAHDGGPAAPFR